MFQTEYRIQTGWEVPGTIDEVAEIFRDAGSLERWWPATFLCSDVLQEGDGDEIGKVVKVLAKGWMPYATRFFFRITESQYPHYCALRAWGDYEGTGSIHFTQIGGRVRLDFDWHIRVRKLLLYYFSFLFKPLFITNHHWAMARGQEGLVLEVERRRTLREGATREIPNRQKPSFPHNIVFLKPLLYRNSW